MNLSKSVEMKIKDYRHGLIDAQIEVDLPLQIRALRKQHVGTQPEMAKLTGMRQPRISAMEKPGEVHFTLETLRRLAEAFDVALIVRFASFSELCDWSGKFNPDAFQVPNFTQEVEAAERTPEPEKVADAGVTLQNLTGLGTPEGYGSFLRRVHEGQNRIFQSPPFSRGPMTLQQLTGRAPINDASVPMRTIVERPEKRKVISIETSKLFHVPPEGSVRKHPGTEYTPSAPPTKAQG